MIALNLIVVEIQLPTFVLVYCICPEVDKMSVTLELSPILVLLNTQLPPVAFCRAFNSIKVYLLLPVPVDIVEIEMYASNARTTSLLNENPVIFEAEVMLLPAVNERSEIISPKDGLILTVLTIKLLVVILVTNKLVFFFLSHFVSINYICM